MGKASRQKKKKNIEALKNSVSHFWNRIALVSSLGAALAGGIWYSRYRENYPQKSTVQATGINFGFLQHDQTEIEKKVQEAGRYPLINVDEGTGSLDPLDYILYNNLATQVEIDQSLTAF